MKAFTKKIAVEASQLTKHARHSDGGKLYEGKPGDWLITYEDKRREIVAKAEFANRFELAPEEDPTT